MNPKKKGAVGDFEVWHTGPSMYEIRNAAGWCVARAVCLNAAYKVAQRWNNGIKAGEVRP